MSARIPDHVIEEIRARADLVEIVSAHTELRRSGRNLRGPCPLHEGEGPNFAVDPERSLYKCFVCGEGGDVFRFVSTRYGITFPDAVRAVAGRLGIEIPDASKPPFKEVGRAEGPAVARALGLVGPEGGPYRCPGCGSDGTLTPRGAQWWLCSNAACPPMGYNHVDLAMRTSGLRPAEACRDLADRLGILGESPTLPPLPTPVKQPAAPVVDPLDSLPNPVRPPQVYREILKRLTLRSSGAVHITDRRRLDPREAADYGFRSASPLEWHEMILPYLESLRDEELAAAGFPRETITTHDGRTVTRIWLPRGGRSHTLVMPYRSGHRTVILRFRDLSDDPDAIRYWSLKGATPPMPFNADALESSTVHIVEGELNAYTLASYTYQVPAVGKPGAGIWNDRWTKLAGGVQLVVGWYDNDLAGRRGAQADRRSMIRVHGEEWTKRHWRRILLPADASDLHREHALAALLRARPWETEASLHTAEIVEAEEEHDRAEEERIRKEKANALQAAEATDA